LLVSFKDITDCDANILSTNDLPPTLHVEKLAKHVEPIVKSIMEPSEDILMFKTVSYRFQTMKSGGTLYYVKVCLGNYGHSVLKTSVKSNRKPMYYKEICEIKKSMACG